MGSEQDNASLENTSLESSSTTEIRREAMPGEVITEASQPELDGNKPLEHKGFAGGLNRLFRRFNIYLLLFVLSVMIGGIVFLVLIRKDNAVNKNDGTINGQALSDDAAKKLSNSDTTIGDAKQTLNVESNAVFTGKVLIRDTLDVAGAIRVGGPLSLPGITVAGTSNFDQIQANKLNIAGDTSMTGSLSIQKNITVSGGGNFGGALSAPQLNIERLQLSQDILLNRHIDAGGGTPRVSGGSGAGGGGTASLNGTDTAGTVTINTGSSPGPGVLATITFAASFAATPHVVITPIGSGGASLDYYVTRSSTGFVIYTANSAPSSTSFSFDYIVID